MKIALRCILYLALIVWLGAEIFFPVVAAITFKTLAPDTHAAGSIVGALLRILHGMGVVAGAVALAALALAPVFALYKPRAVLAPALLLVVMIGGVVYSQFAITPAMDRDRIAAGGAIDTANKTDPLTADFDRLHRRSERVEGAILLLGVTTVLLLAWAENAGV
jgi:uncharacterized membrane protein YedE/YeeE